MCIRDSYSAGAALFGAPLYSAGLVPLQTLYSAGSDVTPLWVRPNPHKFSTHTHLCTLKKNALLNTSPHYWLDGLEALAWCLLVSATHTATTLGGVPSVLLFTCHTSPSTYVWPTSNHPSSDWPILPYVQNPYSPASLRSHENIMQLRKQVKFGFAAPYSGVLYARTLCVVIVSRLICMVGEIIIFTLQL